jgi:hypothetical protein
LIKVNEESNIEANNIKKRATGEDTKKRRPRLFKSKSGSSRNLEREPLDQQKVKKLINFEINIIDTGVGISQEGID